ncbi:MAG TPA: DUF4339 domain-containing protein [Pirellulales bacterium]|nr:DUF4339 domain-containing protein [Pirellulales bacterium]
MGIKFFCPNGHKLNVKDFLRGKKAICPLCGARVVVPDESTRGQTSADCSEPEASDEGESIELRTAADLAEPPAEASAKQSAPTQTAAESAAPLLASGPQSDPIDDSPGAVWYVRPATGGQFGPASGEIMRAWLHEGRVGASSLVWRTPWTEWRSAAAVFPQLAGLLASPRIAVAPPQIALPVDAGRAPAGDNGMSASLPIGHVVQPIAVGQAVSAPPGAGDVPDVLTKSMQRRRRRKDLSVLASAILVILSIILLVILVFVWRRQYGSETPASETPPAVAPMN